MSENPTSTDYSAIRADINWITRLSWGFGTTGNIPLPNEFDRMAAACAEYVAHSNGCHRWIIGNEPQHEQERPNGIYITPEQYARCFILCRDAIKRINPQARVIPAPCAPYHANPVSWLDYWREMLTLIAANGGCDGLAIHAYTRSSDPADINDDVRMGPPLENTCAGFLTYQDALDVVPAALRHLPAYLTEFNELLEGGWDNRNTGVVQEAYRHINWWNTVAADANEPKFQCLILYRWPKFDKWHIDGNQGVIDDFRAAVALGFQSPQATPDSDEKFITHLPSVSAGGTPPMPPTLPPREWDERLTARGVTVETPPVAPGQQFFRLVKARWYNEQEAGGRRNIFVTVLTADGRVVAGVPFVTTWADQAVTNYTKAGTGFEAGNFVMGKSLNEFSVRIDAGVPSEIVHGIGMGADGNVAIHTATELTFVLTTMPAAAPTPAPQPPVTVPTLAHPVQDPAKRVISQQFGDNPQDYAQFGMAGHTGVDFAVPEGTNIVAVDGGEIIEAEFDPDGYGRYLKMRHPWGESLYAHLGLYLHGKGGVVGRGEPIALSGNTGNSTGPHLHFAMRVFPYQRGAPYDGFSDPAPYLINAGAPTQPASTGDLLALMKNAADKFGLEWQLLASLAWAESSWNPNAVSNAGAKGLLQVMAATWAEWAPRVGASDIVDPAQNLAVGAAYLAWLLRQTNGNAYRALCAYLWGIGNVLAGLPVPSDVAAYANKIIHGRDLLVAVGA